MRRWTLIVVGVALVMTPARGQEAVARFAVPESGGVWVVDDARRAGDVRIAPFLGRDAVWLRANTHAIRRGSAMTDGTIAFDLAPMDEGDFVGVTFRRDSFANHENVYLRLRRSGHFMALHYAPRINGSSTWQLYPEFTRKVIWPRNQWTHVRFDVRGSSLDIHVGDAAAPALTVPRMRHASRSGEVAFWARVNDRPEGWAAAIANLTITPASNAAPAVVAGPPPPGFVPVWAVTGPEPADERSLARPPASATWTRVTAEESGLVNLNRLFPVQRGRAVAFARATIVSSVTQHVRAEVGYSDDVTIFVNDVPVYGGRNGWESRMPEFASFVDARFETPWLPLRAGANEIVLAVADDQRFGWGFSLRLEDVPGLRILK